ncbi:hypothetical protein GNZ21_01630 [Nesterenkonia alkaliphila]|uniref:Uncharacterized protein n=2 Tax=Nesterenkonia alkaliphila TaxID=1463631 RepID=A0A7K1UF24_9MICC|nr:hypothetical protein [Nesterenkonia alkaliphila]
MIAAAITGGLVLLIVATGVYGLIIGPPERSSDEAPPAATSQPPSPPAPVVHPVPETNDPEEFATGAAHALFTWDTHTTLMPGDYRQALLEVADPTGEETNGLVADLENYLPDQETWIALQEFKTRQWLEIDEVYVPEAWDEAVAVGGDALEEGTVAYTVTGTRHREGVWYGEPETSAHQVAFTMFLTCPPDGEDCHLLRLSLLDQPLQ